MKFKELFKEASINEGLFSKKKDEDWDFAESFIINALKKIGKKPKGKIKDKSGWDMPLNLWQFVDGPFSYEQKLDLTDYFKKYKFKPNSASSPDDVEGIIIVDGTEFTVSASNDFAYTKNGKANIRIFKDIDIDQN